MTPLIAVLVFVAAPGKAAEPETVLLNDKVLVCDAEGCFELVVEDAEQQTSATEPIINTPALKPESQSEIAPDPIPDLPVVDTSADEPIALDNAGINEPDDRGAQWMMGLGALGILGLAGFVFWTTAWKRDRETSENTTADETSVTGRAQELAQLSIRNINILDDRFSKFEIEIANNGQSPASSVRIDARIIVHRLEADPGDASVTAEKSATEIMHAIPGAAADRVTLGIFLYRDMFKARTDQTAYDVEVNGTAHWTDASDEPFEEPFAFCAPGITGKVFISATTSDEPADQKPEASNNACFVMLPGPLLEHYAEDVSE